MSRVLRFVFLVVAIGLVVNLTLALATSDSGTVAALESFPPLFLLVAAALALVPWFTDALRLWIWTGFLGQPLRYPVAFRVIVGTQLGAAVSPPAVGGVPAKLGLLLETGHGAGRAAALTTLGSAEDFCSFAIVIPIAAIYSQPWRVPAIQAAAGAIPDLAWKLVLTAAIVALIAISLGVVLVASGRWSEGRSGRLARLSRKVVSSVGEFLGTYRLIGARGSRLLLLTIPLNIMKWASRYSVITVLAYGLGLPVDPVLFFVLQWVVFTVSIAIPTPGAAGGAEAAFAAVYAGLIPTGLLGVATAGWRFFTFYLPLIVGSVGFHMLKGPVLESSSVKAKKNVRAELGLGSRVE